MIRSVETHDAYTWTTMRARLWPEADVAELVRETRAFFTGSSGNMLAAAFLAEETLPLGFVELALRAFSDGCSSMPVPHVEGWYVEPFARGHGLGRLLMRAAEDWARDCGFNELASDTELHNVASLRAHRACGFDEVERLIKFRKSLA